MRKEPDLFEARALKLPLSERFRPQKLSEFLGQSHILHPGSLLYEAIEQDKPFSFIVWGPPGCGKTTLARIIAQKTSADFVEFSAVTSGLPEVRKVIEQAKTKKQLSNQSTILFMDEIHRFNKAQQDAFLPYLEKGTIILIGATVENPYFAIINPLASRIRFYNFHSLGREELQELIERVLKDKQIGLGKENLFLEDKALEFLIDNSGGDGRFVLNALELAAKFAGQKVKGKNVITLDLIMDAVQKRARYYDATGSEHYDTISAFIKSLRGSDPNGAVYWLARMIEAGEDPRFIARRLLIAASEEVGVADPFALVAASAAAQAVSMVGFPEARIILAQAVIHIACAPKSNSAYLAIDKALAEVRNKPNLPVPLHLRNPSFKGALELGYGKGFLYPHDFPGHFVLQTYLPDNLLDQVYYLPGQEGYELRIYERLKNLWPQKYGKGKLQDK